MLVTAAGAGFLLLIVPIVLACIATAKDDAVKDPQADRTSPPVLQPVNVEPVAPPTRPIASYVPPNEGATPRPVYVEAARPLIKPEPIRKAVAVVAVPPPAPNPLLQFTEVDVPLFKRLDPLWEDDLLHELSRQVKEVDLESVKGTREKLLPKKPETKPVLIPKSRRASAPDVVRTPVDAKSPAAILALREERADLKGLPMIGAADCQISAEAAKKKQLISQEMRRILVSRPRSLSMSGYSQPPTLGNFLAKHDDWLQEDGISTVVQMMETEPALERGQLVDRLATAKSVKANTTLARLALFDFSRNVREQAIRVLKDRPRGEYRQVLLDGLRYPWAPVAAHAAEALVALDDREAAFSLTALLDAADPCAPARDKNNQWVVREVVRVNHLRNCLLCHAPSTAATDPLRGIVPIPGQSLPRVYYSSQGGDFVRADVTYLRQDFSLIERVAKPDKWPQWQRFDYMIRTRELTAGERAAHEKVLTATEPASYPQRDAVLFALRELTGLDAGPNSADWYELLWATEAAVRH